jgi:isoquinoline 1-oxidoreductase beta subunit
MDKLLNAHLPAGELLAALSTTAARKLSRREFMQATGVTGGGLMLGIALPATHRFAQAQQNAKFVYPPAAFVRIAPDNTVTVLINKLEFGQGVMTSLPMLIAEELECDWSKVRAEHAPAAQVYAHPGFGIQMTGGSTSIASSYMQFRTIGATARQMLLSAASQQWNVPVSRLDTKDGVLVELGGGKRRATYGSLAAAAAKLPVPDKTGIKAERADFKLIGKPMRRIDSREKVNGSAKFSIDHSLPKMRVAVVARPPVFGGKVASFDAAKARAIKGVENVLQVQTDRGGSGVAVIANGYWPAKQGRDALDIKWDLPAGVTTSAQMTQYRELASQPGLPAR